MIDRPPLTGLDLRRWYGVAPDVVFRAFTERRWLERWFCPSADVTLRVTELDVRVGGKYRLLFRFPDRLAVVVGEYRTIAPPHQLVFTWTWEPPDPHAGLETLVTVRLSEKDGGTELALTHEHFPAEDRVRRHESGWNATLDRLGEILSSIA
jgi:uncharacterized protein YndB with AHSA1/START domain